MLAVMNASGKSNMERKTMQVSVRMTDELYEWLDEYRKEVPGVPTKPSAIRDILLDRMREWKERRK